jgi:hypothetical protein
MHGDQSEEKGHHWSPEPKDWITLAKVTSLRLLRLTPYVDITLQFLYFLSFAMIMRVPSSVDSPQHQSIGVRTVSWMRHLV